MAIVRLKTLERDRKVNELLYNMFKLPQVDYSKGYQAKPGPELTGGSSSSPGPDVKLKAVNELRRWTRLLV